MKRRFLPIMALLCAAVASTPVWAAETETVMETETMVEAEAVAPEAVVVITVAGTGGHGALDGDTLVRFNLPGAIAGDGTNVYIADTYNNLIRVHSPQAE